MAKSKIEKAFETPTEKRIYNFPAHDISIEAGSLAEAEAELERQLKSNQKSND